MHVIACTWKVQLKELTLREALVKSMASFKDVIDYVPYVLF